MSDDFLLSDIIRDERICTFFQPIVSLKTGEIFAYEALTRGIRDESRSLIDPCALFAQADRETCSLEFDLLCRKKALENFRKFHTNTEAMMFMNINTSVISSRDNETHHIGTISRQMGFDPENIGLELIESKASSPDELMSFVRKYRDSGFLIVIDDFGCEHSNIDRLIQIHPDIIKVDRSIISCIENDPYRQSILKSIHSLAEMTGSLCLAEGVETLAEIKTCHLLGVDLFQGFAIACPSPDIPRLEEATRTQVRILQGEIHTASMDALRRRRRLTGDINVLADWLIRQIDPTNPESLTLVFQEFIAMNDEVECVYLLDSRGVQISETIVSPFVRLQSRPSIFQPARRGADHAYKPYFACFEALGIQRYLTDVYLSLASGNLCRTFSVQLPCQSDEPCVLCMDFLEEPIRTPSAPKQS
ncbi:MAG TPA: EAL domain-containing protein [Treponemataceae bacterium]|nr:EAL domain-containing protein [Treponemataceae bacterium]